MIWIIIAVTLLLTAVISVFIAGFAIGFDFRAVFDVNQEIIMIELFIFKRLRIARLRARVYADNLYIKFLSRPYRKVTWFMAKKNKDGNKTPTSSTIGKAADIKGVTESDTTPPIKVKSLRINIILGTNDAFLTSMIWGGMGLILSGIEDLITNRMKIKRYSTHYKPHFYGNEFAFDIALGIGVIELLRVASVLKGRKRVDSK